MPTFRPTLLTSQGERNAPIPKHSTGAALRAADSAPLRASEKEISSSNGPIIATGGRKTIEIEMSARRLRSANLALVKNGAPLYAR